MKPSQVEITKVLSTWCLMIVINDQVSWAYTAKSFVDVLNTAGKLQLHVDNLNDLTFNSMQEALEWSRI